MHTDTALLGARCSIFAVIPVANGRRSTVIVTLEETALPILATSPDEGKDEGGRIGGGVGRDNCHAELGVLQPVEGRERVYCECFSLTIASS